ncbi:MAG: glutathione S-transferase family protein [Labilithrix sp.]|nr:glutathione S-transferase family protein [Labilithrix sp.]MCW5814250.1 glutathione S-transferase family protein [Labilithrix sp.]
MKLHFHPVSTASRPVVLFCAEAGIKYEPVVVDLMTGAHVKPPFSTLNPNCQVPVLEDGDFVLTESSAILKYLADKIDSPAYPKDLKKRARVNEVMDWFNTGHYREFAYHLVYPQLFPHHKRPTDAGQAETLQWGKTQAETWMERLDKHVLGAKKFLCGDEITIADYFGAEILAAGDIIGVSYKKWPNVERWMSTMRALPGWKTTNEATDGFAASMKGKEFVTFA